MQMDMATIQELFDHRMNEYEKATANIFNHIQFAIEGIQLYFSTTKLPVTIVDATMIKGTVIFTVLVTNPPMDSAKMFNIGLPDDIISSQSSSKVVDFLTYAAKQAQYETATASPPHTDKRKYH